MTTATVSASYLQILLEGASAAGISIQDLLTEELHGRITDPDGRVDREVNNLLWTEIPRRASDDAFGLHLAETVRPGVFVVVDYAARNAANLRQAMARFVRYCRLVHDGAVVRFEEQGDEARLSYTLPGFPAGSPRHAAEFAVAAWYRTVRQMTQVELSLVSVRFEHSRPQRVDEHRRIFGCEVSFDATEHTVTLRRDVLELPVVKADPKLGALIDHYAEELLQRLPQGHAFSDRVRQMVAENLCDGDHGLEPIAERLHMSPRTLQRRLQDEDTSHQQLVDELRHELAVKYLAVPAVSIGEVAFLLGFSDPSAFHRAFRRWTGTTPGEHRRT